MNTEYLKCRCAEGRVRTAGMTARNVIWVSLLAYVVLSLPFHALFSRSMSLFGYCMLFHGRLSKLGE